MWDCWWEKKALSSSQKLHRAPEQRETMPIPINSGWNVAMYFASQMSSVPAWGACCHSPASVCQGCILGHLTMPGFGAVAWQTSQVGHLFLLAVTCCLWWKWSWRAICFGIQLILNCISVVAAVLCFLMMDLSAFCLCDRRREMNKNE